MEPVQPRPTIATSICGSFCAMIGSALGIPLRSPLDADRRMRIGLIVARHPVAVVIARAGKADHFPRAHVAVTAIERVGKKPLLHVRDEIFEELLAIESLKFDGALLDALEDRVLLFRVQFSECSASLRGGVVGAAVLIDGRERGPILLRRILLGLWSLLLVAVLKGTKDIQSLPVPVSAGELPVNEGRATGLLAARRLRVRWDDAIHNRLDGRHFRGREEAPSGGIHRAR